MLDINCVKQRVIAIKVNFTKRQPYNCKAMIKFTLNFINNSKKYKNPNIIGLEPFIANHGHEMFFSWRRPPEIFKGHSRSAKTHMLSIC